jgi:hypothetical protein
VANFDFSILKNTYLGEGERFNIQLRMEIFNLFNTSNYRLPYSSAGQAFSFAVDPDGPDPGSLPPTVSAFPLPDPFFGQILQARPPREIQFGVKFIF